MHELRHQLLAEARHPAGAKVLAARLYGVGPIAALAAGDGERENFHRSARASPATCGHAGRFTRCYDIAGHSLTS